MNFFDANCCLGKLSVPLPKYIDGAKELIRIMNQSGIEDTLVYHASGKEYSPTIGNRLLFDEVREFPNLHLSAH